MSTRNKWLLGAVMCLIIACGFGGFIWWRSYHKEHVAEQQAEFQQTKTSEEIRKANQKLYDSLMAGWREDLKSVAEKPNDYKANLSLAISYDQLGNKLKAEEYYKKAISINPVGAIPWNNLANIYQDQGRYDEAEQAWQGYIHNFGGDVDGYLGLARLYTSGHIGYQKEKAMQTLEDGAKVVADPTGLRQAMARVARGEAP